MLKICKAQSITKYIHFLWTIKVNLLNNVYSDLKYNKRFELQFLHSKHDKYCHVQMFSNLEQKETFIFFSFTFARPLKNIFSNSKPSYKIKNKNTKV